jgi:hypothetical protein
MSFSKVCTTSSATSVAPLWNLTSWRILKVHSEPSSFGSQLSAIRGSSSSFEFEKERNSPVEPSRPAPPSSWTRSGFGAVDEGYADVSAGLHLPRGRAASGRPGGLVAAAARRCDEREERDRHADDAAAAHEVPSRDLPLDELVDDVVLELAAFLAYFVDAALRLVHALSFRSAAAGTFARTPAYSSS